MLLAGSPAFAQQPPAPRDTTARAAPPVQDTAAPRADTLAERRQPRGDSVRPRPPVSPGGAFIRSLLVPGWGQALLHRDVTGAVFVTFEAIAVTMVWKASWQLDYARERDKYVKSHTQERQDWLFLLLFNHLMAGAEAYVSSHLYDFPVGLTMERLPDGRARVGITVRF